MLTTVKTKRWRREASIRKHGKIIGYVIAAKKAKEIKIDKAKIENIDIKGLPNKACYQKTDAGHLYLISNVESYQYCVIRMESGDQFEVEIDSLETPKKKKKG